jgi:transcription elongation factor
MLEVQPGDSVKIIGGKYCGKNGIVIRRTKRMVVIRLAETVTEVRIMIENAVRAAVEPDKVKSVEMNHQESALTVAAVKEELVKMQARIDELVMLLNKMQT